jgi:parvulin-like peptidyl-prolyl isomerase
MLHATLLAVYFAFQGGSQFPTQHIGVTQPAPDKVIARVNGQDIKASDLQPYLWDWFSRVGVEDLIIQKLIADEAARLGVKVDDKEVEKKFQEVINSYRQQLGTGETIEEWLARRSMSMSRIYVGVHRGQLLEKIAEREFAPKQYINLSVITVPAPDDLEGLTAAINSMNKAYDRLKAGEDWLKVLKSVSRDQKDVDAKGKLGWRPLSMFPENMQAELKGLKAGGYTKPAKTVAGIQLFRVDGKGDTATPQDIEDMRAFFLPRAQKDIMDKLWQNAKIERLIGK